MAVTSNLKLNLKFSGDVTLDDFFAFAQNAASPGQAQVLDLSSGNNTITVPSGGSSAASGVIVIPPSGNAVVLTLKGVAGDTGFAMGLTDPAVLTLGSGVTSFVINAASAVTGVRLFFL